MSMTGESGPLYGGYILRLMVDCGRCGGAVPVNGITASLPCPRCGEAVEIDQSLWANVFGPDRLSDVRGFGNREARESSQLGGLRGRWVTGRARPRCEGCKQYEAEPGEAAASAAAGGFFCPSCGARVPVRPADALCLAVNPAARYVVGEALASAEAQALARRSQPVLFACMGCGGGLQVDGSSRSVTCRYCDASNYLPDGLWLQLNPAPTAEVFYLICEDSPLVAAARPAGPPGLGDEIDGARCPSCGATSPGWTGFCSGCGAQLAASAPPSQNQGSDEPRDTPIRPLVVVAGVALAAIVLAAYLMTLT
jgi:DNA-directed RNA polymerase subunit RPC12/RpoP